MTGLNTCRLAPVFSLHARRLIVRLFAAGAELPIGDHAEEPAMDVPVEAPGTPVASSARGMDGLNDITVPAKAAMLEARVAELEVRMV